MVREGSGVVKWVRLWIFKSKFNIKFIYSFISSMDSSSLVQSGGGLPLISYHQSWKVRLGEEKIAKKVYVYVFFLDYNL